MTSELICSPNFEDPLLTAIFFLAESFFTRKALRRMSIPKDSYCQQEHIKASIHKQLRQKYFLLQLYSIFVTEKSLNDTVLSISST